MKRFLGTLSIGLLLLPFSSLSACASDSPTNFGKVSVAEVEESLRSPIYDPSHEEVFALREDGSRLVRLGKDTGLPLSERYLRVVESEERLEGTGENLAVDPRRPRKLYVPQPDLGEVQALSTGDMEELQTFEAGPAPARVTLDTYGAGTLFVLSEGENKLTAVDLADTEVFAKAEIESSTGTLLDTSRNGNGTLVWTAGPDGIVARGGDNLDVQTRLDVAASALAVDPRKPGRIYVATQEGRLLAVQAPGNGDPEIASEVRLSGEDPYLVARDGLLYCATRQELAAFDTVTLEKLASVDLAPRFREASIERATTSGLAVGEEHVYVTLQGTPHVLLVEKPQS